MSSFKDLGSVDNCRRLLPLPPPAASQGARSRTAREAAMLSLRSSSDTAKGAVALLTDASARAIMKKSFAKGRTVYEMDDSL